MEYTFVDALTGSTVVSEFPMLDTSISKGEPEDCESLFFPGCSLINYAMPLVSAIYETLKSQGAADGISLLCCGKILSYEPDGDEKRASFEADLCERLAGSRIKRIVAACPNCVKALRGAFEKDERMAGIEVVALPTVLAEMGYRIDGRTVAQLVKGDPDAEVKLCTHDSCPDRDYGEFAEGMRALLPEGMWVDPARSRKKSMCCGSLLNAAGKYDAAMKAAQRKGAEAAELNADAIVTPCISCTFMLTMTQPYVQAVHYLELLYAWRVDWATMGGLMKLRFLFDESLGAVEVESTGRAFVGLGGEGETE